jgi:hypothetical protein
MDFKIDNIVIQIGDAIAVPNLASADYEPTSGIPFLIKNDGADTISLEVKYANGTEWISTKFLPGWNVDQVKAIKTNVTAGLDLKRSI